MLREAPNRLCYDSRLTRDPMPHVTSMLLILATLLLSACSQPDPFPPPPQVILPSGVEPALTPPTGPRQMLAMSDPDVDAHISGDVFPAFDDPESRFTGLHPRFRLELPDTSRLIFYLHFFNHAEALQARGPVTIVVNINGKKFMSERFTLEGGHEVRRGVPDTFIAHSGPVDVSLDISPPWHYPGADTYGVLIHAIGFEQAPR